MTTGCYRLTEHARDDLDSIWFYIAEDSVAAADRFIDTIIARIRTIAEQPGIGHLRNEIAPSLRSFPIGNYLIFYRQMTVGIDIVRILSGYRDLPSLFSQC